MAISHELQALILNRFQLDRDGIHGPIHWERVRENGLLLAKAIANAMAKAKTKTKDGRGDTPVDRDVVDAFAWLHDSCRFNDGGDAAHGHRAADFAIELHIGGHLAMNDAQVDLLAEACRYHSHGRTEADITVRVCWDADRLDLGRVGIRPNPKYLCTKAAKRRDTIRWAYARSIGGSAPRPKF